MRKYKHVSPSVAAALGSDLKRARKQRGITLVLASADTGIHFGQLSRFESGAFRVMSENLQKYSEFLRVEAPAEGETLAAKFQRYAARSPEHYVACKLILEGLEKLG